METSDNATRSAATPLVSVVIPTHNRPKLLAEAISSVLANGYDNIEVVISDNSADAVARSVVEGFKDNRLCYVRGPVGASPFANWQTASVHATGDYIFKLDDDDRIMPGFLAAGSSFLNEHPEVASVYPAFAIVDDRTGSVDEVIDTEFFRDRCMVSGADYALGVLINEGGYPRNHKNTPFYRRCVGEAIGFYEEVPEDFAFSVALATRGAVGYLPTVFYHWRIHGQPSTYDLLPIWRGSCEALETLANSSRIRPPPSLEGRWLQVLKQCKKALHLFYLNTALRDHGRIAAWRLWWQMRKEPGDAIPGIRSAILLSLAALLPSQLNRSILALYMRNRRVQAMIKALAVS